MLKALVSGKSGKSVSGSSNYLGHGALDSELSSRCTAQCPDCWSDPNLALAALRHRAARLTVKGAELLQQKSGGGQLQFEGQAWNSCTVAQIALAKAHAEMVLLQVRNFLCRLSWQGMCKLCAECTVCTEVWYVTAQVLVLRVLNVSWLLCPSLCRYPLCRFITFVKGSLF